MEPIYFRSVRELRSWLQKHQASASEVVIGFFSKSSQQRGLTYAEALDEALCFGWIDGLVRRVDADRHTRRFTPRKPTSIWSNINVNHVRRLMREGRMQPSGLAAFQRRSEAKTGVYSFENRPQEFPRVYARRFRANRTAWKFWLAQPPGYRRTVIWWVVSAKQEVTRERRFDRAVAESAAGRRLN
jgi:uncharacterized protein YdeI (YjbR/CyaY-like superfamily)